MRILLAISLLLALTVLAGCRSRDCYSGPVCSTPTPPPAFTPVVRTATLPAPVLPAPAACDPCDGI